MKRGAIAWFAENHVAANLLMVAIVVTGVLTAFHLRQEVFPVFALDTVEIGVEYRGANPEEIERAVIEPIEASLRALQMVRRVLSLANDGRAQVTVEIEPGYDRNRALQEVTAAIQQISVFPAELEPPIIALGKGRDRPVLSVAVYGDVDEQTLVALAHQLEDGLLAEPEISLVEIEGARQPEIHVEVPQAKLEALNLSLAQVATAIGDAALDVPAGTLRTPGGEVRLETRARRETAAQFADLIVRSGADGARLRLGDFADVREGFEDSEREAWFDGRRAVFLSVFSGETQSPLTVARTVAAFIERARGQLPDSVGLTLYRDRSVEYAERLDLLFLNGTLGLLLVLLALGLMLELRVAFWTALGIPVSVLGSLALLPAMDASINMISLFGFIVTLGIVVDDAVVVGEDIFHKISGGMPRLQAAIEGAREMTVPVLFAVSTNIIAFIPLLFVPGETGRFFTVLPAVVISVFVVSLAECLFILPAHLAWGGTREDGFFARLEAAQTRLRIRLDAVMERLYRPVLAAAVRFRYPLVALAIGGLAVVVGYVGGGHIGFAFRPTIQTDFIQAEIELPTGTPVARTREVAFAAEAAARRALKDAGEGDDILVGIFTLVADGGSNLAEVSVMLVPQSGRRISSERFADLWRAQFPPIPDLDSLFFDYLIGPGGSAEIDIQLAHPDVETLRQAATEVAAIVGRYPGVEDVRRGFGRAMPQLRFETRPAGRGLGITSRMLGEQMRNAFHGVEALRQPKGKETQRVVVRRPAADRRSLAGIEGLRLRTPAGGEVPLAQGARVIDDASPVRIERVDGGRVVNVRANVVPGVTTGNAVLDALAKDQLPGLIARYPGLRYSFEGDQREKREALDDLIGGLAIALAAVFALIAVLLRSYTQAIAVILTIPWSLAGAVVGHVALGFDLSVFTIFGMIALSGMAANGAFVLAVTRNRILESEPTATDAIERAALRRFRPIVLTAATTFLGLGPMIFESSLQALFLVPMAISLGVGTLASAAVCLVLVPAFFHIGGDVARALGTRDGATPAEAPASRPA